MADSGSRKSNRRRELECPVCLLRIKNHRTLQCQHVFCEDCLQPLANSHSIRCPLCRKPTPLGPGGVSDLPRNVVLMNILSTLCEECLETDREVCCPHCSKWICGPCRHICQMKEKLAAEGTDMLSEWSEQERRVQEEKVKLSEHTTTLTQRVDGNVDSLIQAIRVRGKEINDLIRQERNRQMDNLDRLSTAIAREKNKITLSSDETQMDPNELSGAKIHTTCEKWKQTLKETAAKLRPSHLDINYTPDPNMIENAKTALGHFVLGTNYRHGKITHHTFGSEGSAHGHFRHPYRVAVSPVTGNKVVIDQGNNRVQILDHKNNVVRVFGSKGKGEGQFDFGWSGVAVTSNGSLVISDTFNDRLQILTEQGKFIRSIGSQGTGQGQFNRPMGVTIHAGNIYVCDKYNHRVQVLQMGGNFVRKFGSCDVFKTEGRRTGTLLSCRCGLYMGG